MARSHIKDFRFTFRDERGRPAHWRCAPITVALNPAGLPGHAMRDLRLAVAQLNAASGYNITIVGRTKARPTHTGDHPGSGPSGTGAAVLVAAGHPGAYGLTDPTVLAQASQAAYPVGRSLIYRWAVVLINTDLPQPSGPGVAGLPATLAHEIGHVLGLDHVRARTGQLMGPYGPARLGSGDIAGVRALNKASCG